MSDYIRVEASSLKHPHTSRPMENRKHKRLASDATFMFYPLDRWGDDSFVAQSVNISGGGLYFTTGKKVTVGHLIILKLRLFDVINAAIGKAIEQEGNTSTIVTAAKVLRVEEMKNGQYFVAVKFDFQTYLEGSKQDLELVISSS